ncbi:hypothetical protein MCHI_000832 [Candidatus Magnetoovum chiemensis]|nr:hypothetical protein MCHI_000832 [Candidatus Magnetoovum chiemensis]
MKQAMNSVFRKLMAMSREELLQKLELEGNGDIAEILIATNALELKKREIEEFLNSKHLELPNIKIEAVAYSNCKVVVIPSKCYTHQSVKERASTIDTHDYRHNELNRKYHSNEQRTTRIRLNDNNITYSTVIDKELKWAA